MQVAYIDELRAAPSAFLKYTNNAGDRAHAKAIANCNDAIRLAAINKAFAFRRSIQSTIDTQFIDYPPVKPRFAPLDSVYEKGELAAYNEQFDIEMRQYRHDVKATRKARAAIALTSNAVGGQFGVSRATMQQLNMQVDKNKKLDRWLKGNIAVGQNGEKIDLAKMFERKMAEFAIVAQGIQLVAEKQRLKWAKIVVTLPPEFHINPKNGNSSWNGLLPDASLRLLRHSWVKCRANLAKHKVQCVGFWTIETHQDGTPHVNFLMYLPTGSEELVEETFIKYMSLGNGSAKAIKFEVKEQYQFDGKCGFAKYAAKGFAKYMSKNIGESALEAGDNQGIEEQTLAQAFGWRRWGFFGIPPLSQWRALRSQGQCPYATPLIDSMWRAARGNDFASFIELNGGLGGKRLIKTFSEPSESGKSKIVVGVEEKQSGFQLRTKRIGYFKLTPKTEELDENNKEINALSAIKSIKIVNDKFDRNVLFRKVTLKVTNPRQGKNLSYWGKKYAEISGGLLQ